jgi:hypothetical protein
MNLTVGVDQAPVSTQGYKNKVLVGRATLDGRRGVRWTSVQSEEAGHLEPSWLWTVARSVAQSLRSTNMIEEGLALAKLAWRGMAGTGCTVLTSAG